MVYKNVLEAVGHTPMIELSSRMVGEDSARVLVKYEGLNVGGSIKTRTALNMIEQAEKDGKITKDTIIVEPTSGNQGIGLALVGAVRGYKTIIIMPDSMSCESLFRSSLRTLPTRWSTAITPAWRSWNRSRARSTASAQVSARAVLCRVSVKS